MIHTGQPEMVLCAGLAQSLDDKGDTVLSTCGQPFVKGSGVEACCSLSCWLEASERRIATEVAAWDDVFGYVFGHGGDDPRRTHPKLYAYKGWKALDRETTP
jgi:hypothetical protein